MTVGVGGSTAEAELAAIKNMRGDVPPIGVVIISDGRKNLDGDPTLLDRLAARGVPVYPVLVGSTEPPKDVAIAGLKVPESVYKGDVAAVEATTFVAEAVKRLFPDQPGHPVRQLHLIASATLHPGQMRDHLRHQHVTPDD